MYLLIQALACYLRMHRSLSTLSFDTCSICVILCD